MDLLSVLERINQATDTESALKAFEQGIAEIGCDYYGVHFLPRPEELLDDVCIAWKVPQEWRELYLAENFCHRDAAFRHSRRTVLAFDWASAPYNPETESHLKEVIDRAHDFNTHKAIIVPIPSPHGITGVVGVAGPLFNERDVHKPVLQVLGLHIFHRLQLLLGRRSPKKPDLSAREREVLAWASEGKTAWEISGILHISQRTVECYFRQAYKKLGATNRLQAIAILGGISGTLRAVPAFALSWLLNQDNTEALFLSLTLAQ